jgi:hypothetical protein
MEATPALELHPDTVLTSVVAFDAVYFRDRRLRHQLRAAAIQRELTKALAAFTIDGTECSRVGRPGIASGKWGCGAFNGNTDVKLLIQWIAASQAGRTLRMHIFDEPAAVPRGAAAAQQLLAAGVNVGQLYAALLGAASEAARSPLADTSDGVTLLTQVVDDATAVARRTTDGGSGSRL